MNIGTKKYLLGISLSFTFILSVLFISPNTSNAESMTVWRYKTGFSGAVYGPFVKEDDCKANLDLYKKTNPLDKATDCTSSIEDLLEPIQINKFTVSETVVDVNAKLDQASNKTIYRLLAPFGGITCMDWSKDNKDPACIGSNIGEYLNLIFRIGIGLCAVLAVIMLIVNGIMYMGEESVFGKTEAKKRLLNSVIGLLLALGSWVILNTINPALTGKDGLSISSAETVITPLYDRGASDPKKANGESVNCTPVVDPTSPCTVDYLAKVLEVDTKTATAMSKICNMESGGKSKASGTDYCVPPGESLPFSFGLFQVNLAANGKLAGEECVGLFDRGVTSEDAIEPKYKSGFNCKLLSGKEALYNKCKNILLDSNKNLAITKELLKNTSKGINNWSGDKQNCASAFQ